MKSEDLLAGQIKTVEVEAKIRDADLVLACVSSRTVERAGGLHCQLHLALTKLAETPPKKVAVIPVKLDACALPDHVLTEFGIRLTDIHDATVAEREDYAKLRASLKSVVPLAESRPSVQASSGYLAELLDAFALLCQGAENAFAANQKPAAKCLMESFQFCFEELAEALDDPEHLLTLPQYLADRQRDIDDNLLRHYFDQNLAAPILTLLNHLPKVPGSFIDHDEDGENLRSELPASIKDILARIKSGISGLDNAQAKTARRALLVIRPEISAYRFNAETVSEQRAALEGLQVKLVDRPRLLTEAVLTWMTLPTGIKWESCD